MSSWSLTLYARTPVVRSASENLGRQPGSLPLARAVLSVGARQPRTLPRGESPAVRCPAAGDDLICRVGYCPRMTDAVIDLSSMRPRALLALYSQILTELVNRRIV